MDVTVSFFGRFWSFNLAYQLAWRGHLCRLITSYPSYKARSYGVPKNRVQSLPHYETLNRLWSRGPGRVLEWDGVESWIKERFENAAAKRVPNDTDIFVGLSGSAEAGIDTAKDLGSLALLERGSTHIDFQREILLEESERQRESIEIPDSKIIDKEKMEYEKADAIVVPSRFVKNSFISEGVDEDKLIKIPYGVDTSEFKEVNKEDDTFRVIFSGQMMLRKGVHYLLKAFAELDLPDAELWLIGAKRPEIDPYFKKYHEHFRFLGHKPQSELYRYYSQGSVFAICSVEEGLAMVQPQAMACGLPLICTPNTGGEDLIRDGKEGFTVPLLDVEALKERLLWCYENREACRVMGQKAKNRVHSQFTWDDYGEKVVQEYQRLLGG